MLHITSNKGFQLTFTNGLTISVQFGAGHYCDNKMANAEQASKFEKYGSECKNSEIVIFDENNEYYDFDGRTQIGWASADKVAHWISAVQAATSILDIVAPQS